MSLFFKKKKGNLEENGLDGNGSNYFEDAIEKKKLKVARWLNQKTAGYSSLQKKVILAAFCISFGVSGFYILSGCIRDHGFRRQPVVLQHLRSGMPPRAFRPVTDSIFREAEKTKLLLDSLQLIERIYQSKIK